MISVCPPKWIFWQAALERLQVDLFKTPNELWSTLSMHNFTNTDPNTLIQVGTILAVVWQSHWSCFRQMSPWAHSSAMALLEKQLDILGSTSE